MKCALENGYTIIRIGQEEIWRDKYDWKTPLLNSINTEYSSPAVVYISNNEVLYDRHKKEMLENKEENEEKEE